MSKDSVLSCGHKDNKLLDYRIIDKDWRNSKLPVLDIEVSNNCKIKNQIAIDNGFNVFSGCGLLFTASPGSVTRGTTPRGCGGTGGI